MCVAGVRGVSVLLAVWGMACPAWAFKVYVFVDMEGVSGITCSEQTLPGAARYEEGRQLMAGDINACVAGCFAAGATAVVVRDGHGAGTNVVPADVDARATLVQGPTPGVRFKGIEGAEALILLGYHAQALTPGAVLAHTYSSATIQRLWLNGFEVGETAVDALIAGEHGVPVVMVSGDDKVAAEARRWIPGVEVCETKTGTGPQSAEALPLEAARGLIQARTEAAVRKRRDVRPVRASYPARMVWEYLPKGSLRTYDPAFRPVAQPRREEKVGDSVERLLLGK